MQNKIFIFSHHFVISKMCWLDVITNFTHVFRNLIITQNQLRTSIWNTLSPKAPSDPHSNIVFQPMARATAAHTKTNRGDRIGAAFGGLVLHSMCAKWMCSVDSGL